MADVTINIDKFNFNRRPKDGDLVLEISGTASGILSQILTFLGLSTRSFLKISRREVRFEFSNLGGTDYIVCPMDAITCSLCGVNKPLWRLLLGILLLGVAYIRSSFPVAGRRPLSPRWPAVGCFIGTLPAKT